MVRSGCVSSLLRACSPTTIVPSVSALTTDGQRVFPVGPGIHFGWPVCESTYATRLFVVPRSIPTMRPIPRLCLCQFFLHAYDQIANVRAAVQMFIQTRHDFLLSRFVRFRVNGGV